MDNSPFLARSPYHGDSTRHVTPTSRCQCTLTSPGLRPTAYCVPAWWRRASGRVWAQEATSRPCPSRSCHLVVTGHPPPPCPCQGGVPASHDWGLRPGLCTPVPAGPVTDRTWVGGIGRGFLLTPSSPAAPGELVTAVLAPPPECLIQDGVGVRSQELTLPALLKGCPGCCSRDPTRRASVSEARTSRPGARPCPSRSGSRCASSLWGGCLSPAPMRDVPSLSP